MMATLKIVITRNLQDYFLFVPLSMLYHALSFYQAYKRWQVKVLHEVFNMEHGWKTIYCKFSFVEVTLQTSLRKIWKGMLHSFQSYLNLKSKTYQHCGTDPSLFDNLCWKFAVFNQHNKSCGRMQFNVLILQILLLGTDAVVSQMATSEMGLLLVSCTEMNFLYLVIYSWWRLPQSRADAATSGHF